MPMKPKLDFMIKISNSTDGIERVLDPIDVVPAYMASIEQMIDKLSKNKHLSSLLKSNFIDKPASQRRVIYNLKKIISLKIAKQLPEQSDYDDLYSYFVNWDGKNPDDSDINRVKDALESMKKEYRSLRSRCDYRMNEIRRLKADIDFDIIASETLVVKASKMTKIDDKTVKELKNFGEKTFNSKEKLIFELHTLRDIVDEYNFKRRMWVHIVVGSRNAIPRRSFSI